MSVRRLALRVLAGLLLAALVLALALWLALRASLADLDGSVHVPGLAARATIERDALGVPMIRAASRIDVARATGFVHAQERFFQMDLTRRAAAGELAALLGPPLVDVDRRLRRHELRTVARQALAVAPSRERALLEAYAEGVNAGLAALAARPPEYLALRQRPVPWRAEDSLLVVLAMWVDLQGSEARGEQQRDRLKAALPEAAYRFIYSPDPDWEAALDGSVSDAAPLPAAADFDLRRLDRGLFVRPAAQVGGEAARLAALVAAPEDRDGAGTVGSNNWALAGAHTASGAALVANDMHLGLRVPNTWYRARLVASADGVDVTGVTLPGVPTVIAGSNGHVAWGFTNSYGDYQDLVVVEPVPGRSGAYLTPAGPRPLERVSLRIDVAGSEPVDFEFERTIWGPVVATDTQGRRLALAWTAHRPDAVNLALGNMESARDLDAAVAIAMRAGAPAQNAILADSLGRIAWVLMGRIPRRVGGYDASLPSSWARSGTGWDGWVEDDRHPRIVDPPGGRAWSANARVVGGELLGMIGDGGYAHGARSRQIRDRLATLERAEPRDLLQIQVDDRALYLGSWRDMLLGQLDAEALAGHPRRAEFRRLVEGWSAHAAVNDAGYRLLRDWHRRVVDRLFETLTAGARARWPGFRWRTPAQFEYAARRMLTEQPVHLLDPRFASWRDWVLATVDEVAADAVASCGRLADCTWGRANEARIRHPLSLAVPALSGLLDMPATPLPGDVSMPRVQAPDFGASERFAVSPGREAEAYFHMPGGQSGHPLSPYYRAGHEAWERGEPLPFLPGPAVHTLHLE